MLTDFWLSLLPRHTCRELYNYSLFVLDSLLMNTPKPQQGQILCSYTNTTSQLQIARIAPFGLSFERVVFPGQRLLFNAHPMAQLEIYVGKKASAALLSQFDCSQLRVHEIKESCA